MAGYLTSRAEPGTTPITALSAGQLSDWLKSQPKQVTTWVKASGFAAMAGTVLLLPDDKGAPHRVLAGIDPAETVWSYADLPGRLPEGSYRFDPAPEPALGRHAALGWLLGTYVFTRYKKSDRRFAKLVCPRGVDRAAVARDAQAIFLVRDLINTPAADMGPAELAAEARALSRRHKARLTVTTGDALLKNNFPMIHAVGRAAAQAPRLIDLKWGSRGPKVTLVGKGVCFDSGGLDLKPASGMLLMKKDMGGGAHVLGLADMIMGARLPLRLRVLVPAVENAVSGDAFRPLDVLKTRKGLTVEVGNTDAEGRLVLGDALSEAARESPDLIVDFATLTGAARVALGTEVPAFFTDRDSLAEALMRHAASESDPLWRLPLHKPYRRLLDSKVADLNNVSSGSFGGAITAALFLAEFVGPEAPWVHFDLMAWNLSDRPGRPQGGEAMGLRAVYALVAEMAANGKGKTTKK
jgi:leucyl aminopeptidase